MNHNSDDMRGVTLTDTDGSGALAFDLLDILELLPDELVSSTWDLQGVEAVGEAADELHAASDREDRMEGARLHELAASVTQIIDGTFRAFAEGEDAPWLIVQAVDSSAYDVLTNRADLLASIRRRFRSVRTYPTIEAHR
jgi:hypothetical protein